MYTYGNAIKEKRYLKRIQVKREEMIQLGKRYGLTNDKTIFCSQELDTLLNEYYKFQQSNDRSLKPVVIKESSFIIYKSKKHSNERVVKYNVLNAI
ncbi:aspartyl-phosphate phosphatase Spo0E family protein [Heyndrickxia vini]|uniref:Aspartyl-phosphate phosphatase Spo0E family protein n=1 Tax=Heyndrickxia vini TaxID=1476025 RepID=A0ABX7E1A2_9BACI|nr:aspartyl-phosphate phosphatase Spo0E family protein [Heyndrickxia vini]QQZ08137.1 aspartyl-phosphate phosphatase Spo0E family protein [Heyndrickxia vini]